ncbi:Lamin tail domain-containing protein [Sulfidibacter corallicola]|uniref:Lamin tail domain-containing protein n=1 Tax=Sulfidibacter corallicola TaxID=2818388 RepID=A0A8A4TK00_SULCO|nr:lamin tail domain-containing protein [Sulfidibacter corallicola]QTD49191.1 lamin tail domain-containing protein [Sulfidibacter corallicola]
MGLRMDFRRVVVLCGTWVALLGQIATAQVVINEVLSNPDGPDGQWVELANLGETEADLSGWFLCDRSVNPAYVSLGENRTIPPGGIVAVDLSGTGQDSATLWVLSAPWTIGTVDGEMGLYVDNNFGSPASIRSYMQWGSGNHPRATVAVDANIWTDAAEFVTAPAAGASLSFTGTGGGPFGPNDWEESAEPDLGLRNGTPTIVLNELLINLDQQTEQLAELKNIGLTTADASEWWLCNFDGNPRYVQLGTDRTIPPGGFVIIHMNSTGTDTATDWFPNQAWGVGALDGEFGLYATSDFGSAEAIRGYVQWGSGGHTRASVAVAAGIWGDAADFVEAVDMDHSMEFFVGDGLPYESGDWVEQAIPTLGEENGGACLETFLALVAMWPENNVNVLDLVAEVCL